MESASPEHQPDQPPGHLANFIGIVIATMTLTLPLYAISNFNASDRASELAVPEQSPISMKVEGSAHN